MRRTILLILIALSTVSNPFALMAAEDFSFVELARIRTENGDNKARQYIHNYSNPFELPKNAEDLYCRFMWCILTINMYNDKPSQTLFDEYIQVVDSSITPVLGNELKMDQKFSEFVPDIYMEKARLCFDFNQPDKGLHALEYLNDMYTRAVDFTNSCKDYFFIPYTLGQYYTKTYPDFEKGILYLKQAKDALELHNLTDTQHYLEVQYSMALTYCGSGKYSEALQLYDLVLQKIDSFPNIDNTAKLRIRDEYERIKALDKGKTIHIDASAVHDHMTMDQCLSLIIEERYDEVLPSLINLKNQYSENVNLYITPFVNVCNYLSVAYNGLGRYEDSSEIINEVEAKIGLNNIPVGTRMSLYSASGIAKYGLLQYDSAIEDLTKALPLSTHVNAFEKSKLLMNIALCYMGKKDYLSAKHYCDEACIEYEQSVGPLHDVKNSSSVSILNTKARILFSLGDFTEAESIYTELIRVYADEPYAQSVLNLVYNNLSVLYAKTGRWDRERDILLKAKSDDPNKEYQFTQNLAISYIRDGITDINHIFDKLNRLSFDALANYGTYFAKSEWEDFWSQRSGELMLINNAAAMKMPAFAGNALNCVLSAKQITTHYTNLVNNVVHATNDTALQAAVNTLRAYNDKLSKPNEQQDSIAAWQAAKQKIEREIVAASRKIHSDIERKLPLWTQVKAQLQSNEAAVEFTYVSDMDWMDMANSVGYYAAYIVTATDSIPRFVTLCTVDNLDYIIEQAATNEEAISNLYSSTMLHDLLWRYVAPHLAGIDKVYYAPVGTVNFVNFDAIKLPDSKLLKDCLSLQRVSSISNIDESIQRHHDLATSQSMVLYGGIDYDTTNEQMASEASQYTPNSNYFSEAIRGDDSRGSWTYLPASLKEVNDIVNILPPGCIYEAYTGHKAVEESVKALNNKAPDILHIATHGFFFNDNQQLDGHTYMMHMKPVQTKDDNLIRSGLLFAGANNAWLGRGKVNSDIEDGVLTGNEIASLNLHNVKLLALSACETGRGTVDPIEGVFGLQKAFKRAGVGSILMSLWKIPDNPTSKFMTEFYRNYFNGKNPTEALHLAQSQMIADGYTDPYYWAAFVVLD